MRVAMQPVLGQFGPVEMAWYLALLRDTDTMRNAPDHVADCVGSFLRRATSQPTPTVRET